MLMEDVIRDQSFAMGLDGSPAKLTKEHRRSSTVFSDTAAIPGLAIAARSAPGTMRRSQAKDRPQSFYVTRSSSETPETRTRTFSEINGDPTQSDRQRHCQTLLKHLRELCTISRRLAHYLEFDPSPVKAAATFIQHYDELLRVYSDWAAVVGDIIASGIGNTIPAKAALRRKDTMRTRRRSLRYGDEDVRKPTAELLLADIVSAAHVHKYHDICAYISRPDRSSNPLVDQANTYCCSKRLWTALQKGQAKTTTFRKPSLRRRSSRRNATAGRIRI